MDRDRVGQGAPVRRSVHGIAPAGPRRACLVVPGVAGADPRLPALNIECIWDPEGQDKFISSHHMRGVPVKIYKATPENCPTARSSPARRRTAPRSSAMPPTRA
ncbi:MAG: hypothetical protein ACLSDQ_00155 [Adlercreutzia equolifaciens]